MHKGDDRKTNCTKAKDMQTERVHTPNQGSQVSISCLKEEMWQHGQGKAYDQNNDHLLYINCVSFVLYTSVLNRLL